VGGNLGRGVDLAGDWVYYGYMRLVEAITESSRGIQRRRYIVGKLAVILMELDPDDLDPEDSSMAIKKEYIYAHGQILAQHDVEGGQGSDERYFYLHDRLGSVRMIVEYYNDAAYAIQTYTYEPLGDVIKSVGSFDNPFRFTGQYYDAEIDEYYLRARQYNPQIARFTTHDPVFGKHKRPLTLHPYLYCLNNPVNMIDPTGEFGGIIASLPARAKNAAVSVGAKAWAFMKIEKGVIIGNAIKSGFMNSWFGPDTADDRAKFAIGAAAGALEAIAFLKTGNASFAGYGAAYLTSIGNEIASSEPFFTPKAAAHIFGSLASSFVEGPLQKYAEPLGDAGVLALSLIRELFTIGTLWGVDMVAPERIPNYDLPF